MKHGTETAYVHHRCRCDECRRAAASARNGRRLLRPYAPSEHGRYSSYANGCRCNDCRTAKREYMRKVRHAK